MKISPCAEERATVILLVGQKYGMITKSVLVKYFTAFMSLYSYTNRLQNVPYPKNARISIQQNQNFVDLPCCFQFVLGWGLFVCQNVKDSVLGIEISENVHHINLSWGSNTVYRHQ